MRELDVVRSSRAATGAFFDNDDAQMALAICVLVEWFYYILQVLGRLCFDNCVEKKVLTTSLTKLPFWTSTF